MRDPYEVLGVSKSASAAAIKSAFRRLAKKLHPDANKHDPKAATRFAELNAAYEIVGDEDKRKAFDAARSTPRASRASRASKASARSRRGGGFGQGEPFRNLHLGPGRLPARGGARRRRGGGGIDDILRGMFGGARAARGAARHAVRAGGFRRAAAGPAISRRRSPSRLPEAAKGTKTPRAAADRQGGRGQDPGRPRRRPADPAERARACRRRRQRRRRADHGHRRAASAVQARRRRPAARTAGHALRGGARRQGARADARRRGRAGDSRPAPIRGRTFRLKGKGLPSKNGAGDLLATVRIVLPERGDAELEELMRKWRDGKPYDPRKDLDYDAELARASRLRQRLAARAVLSICS